MGKRDSGFGLRCLAFLFAIPIVIVSLVGDSPAREDVGTDVRDAMVKIYSVSARPNWDTPWVMFGNVSGSGSGCVIEGNRILTNAHVVSYSTYVQVRLHGRPEKTEARVIAVSHAADLALLTVDDPSFFDGVSPLRLGDLPAIQDDVVVYGFPQGGDTLSSTRGVVSRIEHNGYAHSSYYLLAGQIDAVINPGNSGGPVMNGDRIAGVVMQSLQNSENIGYMVPVPVIRHFLTDLADGRYDGIPSAPIGIQRLENRTMRAALGMGEEQSGILVLKTVPGTSPHGKVLPGDVILEIDGYDVANDGTVEFRPKERTCAGLPFEEHQVGEEIRMKVLRKGQEVDVAFALNEPLGAARLVPHQQYDVSPSYFVYGGLVFSRLTLDYLMTWGREWYDEAPPHLLNLYANEDRAVEGEEVVLLQKILPAGINEGYHDYDNLQVVEVNGERIYRLADLMAVVERPSADRNVTFRTESGRLIVIDREGAATEQEKILDTYKVLADRSEDLKRGVINEEDAIASIERKAGRIAGPEGGE